MTSRRSGQPALITVKAHLASTSSSARSNHRASYVLPARELIRFRLGEERVDIRRWPVYAADGRLVGAVDKLMVEAASRKVRYVTVSLIKTAVHDDKPIPAGSVLVPIGVVKRLDHRHAITLARLNSNVLGDAPRLPARAITRGDEDATLAGYGMSTSREVGATDFYDRSEFDDAPLLS
ncbi:MAG: PRC-barrel domain-containing protein [Gemmatimonadaceae bacterium]